MTAAADTRYSFAPQFLTAAQLFAQLAAEIEDNAGDTAGESDRVIHRGYVVSTIIQCVAALETELYEVTTYGPGSHLGSNGTDKVAREFLKPCAEMINRQRGVVLRYETVLHLLKRSQLKRDSWLYQHTGLLIRVRNELVHYESEWGNEMKSAKWQKMLRSLKHPKPPFVPSNSNFSPHLCLSAGCAKWAVRTTVAFMDDFYNRLGVDSPLALYKSRLALQ